jgi:hypothetical protein
VATFVRALGTDQCFQFPADQVLQLGVDDSVFFDLSLNDFQGVCGHPGVYHRMCEFTQNSTDVGENPVTSMKRKKTGEDKQSEPNDKE